MDLVHCTFSSSSPSPPITYISKPIAYELPSSLSSDNHPASLPARSKTMWAVFGRMQPKKKKKKIPRGKDENTYRSKKKTYLVSFHKIKL